MILRLFAIVALSIGSAAAWPAPVRLAVMDVGLTGDLGEGPLNEALAARARMASDHLRAELSGTGLYGIADNAHAAELIERYESVQHLHKCNGCELDIAKALGAQQVFLAWVHRVSNLILTLNYEIRDADSGAVIARSSFSFRGDNDMAWKRAVEYLVRDLQERKEADSG